LYGDDRLVKDPNQVATNDQVAWATSFWFWRTRVAVNPDVKNGKFGTSTKIINGIECGSVNTKAVKRFSIYKIVLSSFNVNETPIENGCYN